MWNLEPFNTYLLVMKLVISQNAYVYDAYKIRYKMINVIRRLKTMTEIFYAINRDRKKSILGMSLLFKHNIILYLKINKWYFGDSIEIISFRNRSSTASN